MEGVTIKMVRPKESGIQVMTQSRQTTAEIGLDQLPKGVISPGFTPDILLFQHGQQNL